MSNTKNVAEALVAAKAALVAAKAKYSFSDDAQYEAQLMHDMATRALNIAAFKLETANAEMAARGLEAQAAEEAVEKAAEAVEKAFEDRWGEP